MIVQPSTVPNGSTYARLTARWQWDLRPEAARRIEMATAARAAGMRQEPLVAERCLVISAPRAGGTCLPCRATVRHPLPRCQCRDRVPHYPSALSDDQWKVVGGKVTGCGRRVIVDTESWLLALAVTATASDKADARLTALLPRQLRGQDLLGNRLHHDQALARCATGSPS